MSTSNDKPGIENDMHSELSQTADNGFPDCIRWELAATRRRGPVVTEIIGCRKSSSSNTERELQVAFLAKARGMIEFYLVLENIFAVSPVQIQRAKAFGRGFR